MPNRRRSIRNSKVEHSFGDGGQVMKSNNRIRDQLFSSALCCVLLICTALATTAFTHRPSNERPANPGTEALRRGEELRRKWELASAEASFREAAALDPASLEAALGLARIARARFEYAYAIRLLDKASNEHPNSVALLNEYGSVYL